MYQALYRKWRPKTFDEVVGQEHITETLKNQIVTGRLSHAYLFIGTRGTGKTTCAKILAKALNCQHPENGNPCGKCPACLGIEDGSIMDVVEIDAASNNGVDNVRQLRDEAMFSPVSVKKRVYIIDEVHMLSTAAFNALLKILEEPPAHLAFILATTELNKVPATILSRCQRHSFKRLEPGLIAKHLEHVAEAEGLELEHSAAELIAGLAEGGMRDALSLLDQCSGQQHIDLDAVYSAMGLTGNRRTAQLLDYTIKKDTDSALELFSELWLDGKDPATMLNELNALQRDCLMLSVAPRSGASLLSGAYSTAVMNALLKKLSKAELINRINTVCDYIAKIKDSKSPRMIAELCIVSLCDPSLSEDIMALRARVSRLEEDIKNAPVRVSSDFDDEEFDAPFMDIPPDEPRPVREAYEPEDVDDIDPSEFAEYQPEDDFLDKAAAANPLVMDPDAPAEAVSQATDSTQLWADIVDKCGDKLPGLCFILEDSNQVRGEIDYESLTIYADSKFAYGALNKQGVLMRIREAAKEVCGRSLKLSIQELTEDKKAPVRDISELEKFKEFRYV